MTAPTVLSRYRGALLGVATGDALGATLEFVPAERITAVHRDIVGGGAFGWRPGQGTDDTDLTWTIASAHLDTPTDADDNAIVAAAAERMLAWHSFGPRDIGGTTAAALRTLRTDGDPSTSGAVGERTAGNGSLMRCLPTALALPDDHARRRGLVAALSAITHAEPRAVDACVAYTDVAAALLAGTAPADALATTRAVDERDPRVADALSVDPATPVEHLATSGYVIDSLRCAAWAISQTDPLEDTLVALVNRGDDADTTGAIAGGLLGALHGADELPARWVDRLEYRDRLIDAADELHRRASSGATP